MKQTDGIETMVGGKTYIMIVDSHGTTTPAGRERFSFKHFGTPDEVIRYVANMSAGGNKVHKLMRMDAVNGKTTDMEIRFMDGRFVLEEIPIIMEIRMLPLADSATNEVYRELAKRMNVSEYVLTNANQEVKIPVSSGDNTGIRTISGPCRILVNYN